MIRRVLASAMLAASCALLQACSLLFPEDWRVGEESIDECQNRMTGTKLLSIKPYENHLGELVPTFTYDISAMDLEAIQELIKPGSDETFGSRRRAATNENSTAVAEFMRQPVDETGTFFFGQGPRLYRVRGDAVPFDRVVSTGCLRQLTDMRLIAVDVRPEAEVAAETEADSQTDSKTENENNS